MMTADAVTLVQEEEQKLPKKELQERYDGRAKVTGAAKYAAEFPVKNVSYAWLVQSTIACGQLLAIDQTAAKSSPGVLAVLTPFNAPKLPGPKIQPPASRHITGFKRRTSGTTGSRLRSLWLRLWSRRAQRPTS